MKNDNYDTVAMELGLDWEYELTGDIMRDGYVCFTFMGHDLCFEMDHHGSNYNLHFSVDDDVVDVDSFGEKYPAAHEINVAIQDAMDVFIDEMSGEGGE